MPMNFTHLYPTPLNPNRVAGRAPPGTNIKQLGLTTEAVNLLTPNAARLDKAQLEALANDPEHTERQLGLTVADINSIKAAFTTPMQISALAPMDLSVSCCCCTPCCCAAAVAIEQAVC